MKKLKSLALFLLVFTIIVNLVPLTAFASPCCYLDITNITQDEDGIITVNYEAINPVPNREIKVEIKTAESYNRISVYEDTFYIPADGLDVSDIPYTFDGTFLLENYKYEITLSYTKLCGSYYCSLENDRMEFTVKNGVPTFDYDDILDGMLDLIGESKAAVKLTAGVAGMYSFSLEDEWNYDLRRYPQDFYFRPGTSYYNENEELIVIISTTDESDLSASFTFGKAEINEIDSKTDKPVNNDVCFEISDKLGLNAINITQTGLYSFEVMNAKPYRYFELINDKGEPINTGRLDANFKSVLNPGVYYLDTTKMEDEYNLVVRYIVPEELKINHTYAPEYADERVTNYYLLKVDSPSVLEINNPSTVHCGIYINGHREYVGANNKEILYNGEFFIEFTNDVEAGAHIKFTLEPFKSVSLKTDFMPEINKNNYYYYFAFCAPKDGKYEFDFSNLNMYYWFNGDMDDSSGRKYYTREMKKDEWILIGMHEQAWVSVSEYVKPEVKALAYEEPSYFDFFSGKEYIYSFTPSQDDMYKIYTENTYCRNIKIWTDDEVLFENNDNYNYSIDENFELKKNVPVYISFSGEGNTYNEQSSVVVKSPYEEITSGSTVELKGNADVMVYYIAKESGYHNFNFSRGYDYSNNASFTIKDKYYNVGHNDDTDVMLYLDKDEKLIVTFNKFSGSHIPQVHVNISMIDINELSLDTSCTPSDKAYFSYTPESDGVYKVIFPKNFNVDIKSDESDYLSFGEYNEHYFVGKAGKKYLIYTRTNIWGMPEFITDYPDLRITKAETTDIDTNSLCTFDGEFKIFTFYVPETGLYRIENDLCNTRLDLYFNGKWSMISGIYSSLFRLEESFNCIISTPLNTDVEGIDKPSAKFNIKDATDNNKVNITVEDGFVSPLDGMLSLRFCITSPYDVYDLSYGIEYIAENGETVQSVLGYEAMYGSNMRYAEGELFSIGWSEGETHTVRPFVFIGDDEFNKIFGEEKDVTFNLRDDIIPLKYNKTTTPFKVQTDYTYYYREYWYEFTVPEDAEGYTYVTVPLCTNYYELYDEDYTYVSSYIDGDSNLYYDLEPGKKYYLNITSRCDDSDAEIGISTLPSPVVEDEEVIANAEVTDDHLSFVVKENETETDKLYAAVYDENGVLIEIITIDNPKGAYSIKLNNSDDTNTYKLMLLDDNTLSPLCNVIKF